MESPDATTEQVLEASRQLGLLRKQPRQIRKRKPKPVKAIGINVLGTK
jgi:hypothetical protein